MSNVDVVARLQLRAEQFSSESGRAFAEMSANARRAAESLPQQFNSSFAEVNKIIERSLKMPRTATGGLDLSTEITSLRQAATAADTHAAAMRELSEAMQRTAFSGNGANEAILREADAAMVASRASEADATANRQRAAALEEVQAELNKTASATRLHTSAANDNAVKSAQQRAGMQQLSYQLNDVATQYASGTKASIIFAQQSGQVIQAIQLMAGEAKGFLGILAGPWGIVLTSALVVLAPFVGKLIEGGDALSKETDRLRENAEKTGLAERAKRAFEATEVGAIASVKTLTAEIDKQNDALRTNAERLNLAARGKVETLVSEQQRLRAEAAAIRSRSGTRADALEAGRRAKQADDLDPAIAAARVAVEKSRIGLAAEAAERQTDPLKRINDLYREQRRLAYAAADAAASSGKRVTTELTRRLAEIDRDEKRAVENEQRRQAAAKKADISNRQTGRPLSSMEAAAIVRGIGGQVNSADRSYSEQAALYAAWIKAGKPANNPVAKPGTSAHEMGNALDVQMGGGMTPAKLREAFQREGVALTKVFAEKGHWHVEWAKSGTAARDLAQGIREAEQEQAKLAAALDAIQGKFDPAAVAARAYAKELAEIEKLEGAGKITGAQADVYRFRAMSDENARRATTANEAGERILAPLTAEADRWFEDMRAQGKAAQEERTDTWRLAADALRDAAGSLSDLFGARLSGPLNALLRPGGIEAQSEDIAKVITDCFGRGMEIAPESLKKMTDDLASVIGNASYGQIGGSVFASITGGKENKLGSSLGGIVGGEAGKAVGAALTKGATGLLKSLGNLGGPLGAIAGGVLGSVIGGLFKKKSPSGSADITGTGSSEVATSGKLGSALTGTASSVQKSLTQIAEQLGAMTGAFSVSIGKSGDWYHVAGTAGADVSAAHPRSPLIYEGKDESLAVQAAILDAFRDGAIKGISDASQRILQSGQDLDAALQKALLIEAVPRDLKAMLDPVGAAIDELNRKFAKTVDALKEGGASAEQMAQAQRLYDLQLAQTKNSTSSASQALKDFLTSLKVGSSSPYSLRDQEATARATLSPFLDQIAAGQSIDQAKYASAANAFLDIERQLYGSTQAYFDALDAVQAATNKAISTIDNAAPITTAVESPFAKATAESTAKAAAAAQAGNEMAEDTNALLARLVDQNGQLLAALGAGGVSDFIGSNRLFVSAA